MKSAQLVKPHGGVDLNVKCAAPEGHNMGMTTHLRTHNVLPCRHGFTVHHAA